MEFQSNLVEVYIAWVMSRKHILIWCGSFGNCRTDFDVLLTVHLSIFISVINLLDAQNLFHNKFYFMPLHVSSTCAHLQEVKIALHSLWYHHTYRWHSRARDGHL